MKNLLLYNYGLNISSFNTIDENTMAFYVNYDKYYFTNIKNDIKDIEIIYKYLSSHQTDYHQIIPNKNNSFVTLDNNNKYILIKIKTPENIEIDLMSIVKYTLPIDNNILNLKRNNWGELWSAKIDYLEYQISELGQSHPAIIKSFGYYVGLAENAISYYNIIDTRDISLTISHKRINYPLLNIDYYNPLSIIVDNRSRDIAEYLKSSFFNDGDPLNDLKKIINMGILTNKEYNLLFIRLLYPSYYFDQLTMILEQNYDEDNILKYTTNVDRYEDFLRETFYELSKVSQMLEIDWLIKKRPIMAHL